MTIQVDGSLGQRVIRQLPFERMVPSSVRQTILFWGSISLLLITASLLFAPFTQNPGAYLGLCIPQALGVVTVPLAYRFCYRQLIGWADALSSFVVLTESSGLAGDEDIRDWFLRQITMPSHPRAMYFSGVLMASVSFSTLCVNYFVGVPSYPRLYAYGLLLLSGYFAGVGIHGIFVGARALWRLGRTFQVRVARHKFGVLSTGSMLLGCYLAIAVAWSIFLMSAIVGNPNTEFLMTLGPPTLVIGIPTFVVILGSFVICQVPLHCRMIEYKKTEILKIDEVLDRLALRISDDSSGQFRESVEFFEKRKEQLITLPEWPFSLTSLIGATASSILPMVFNAVVSVVREWDIVKLVF